MFPCRGGGPHFKERTLYVLSSRRRWLIPAMVALVLVLLVPSTILANAFWQQAVLIDNNAGKDASMPQVAMFDTDAVAVWEQWDGENNRIYSNYSSDSGLTWHNSILIENNTGKEAIHPQVAISGKNAVAVWAQSDGKNYRIYANYSSDCGATWHDPRLIESNEGYDGSRPQAVIYGFNLAVVWSQGDGQNGRIYCNASTNGGISWAGAETIDNPGHDGYLPAIAASGRNIIAVWNQDYGSQEKIYSTHSMDGGINWQKPMAIEQEGGNRTTTPSLAVSGASVVAVWNQDKNGVSRIYCNNSGNGATTWENARLIDDAAHGGIAPQVAISGTKAVAVWNCDSWIASNYSTNNGDNWHAATIYNNPDGRKGYNPRVALFGHNAVAVWEAFDASGDGIYSSHSRDGGITWTHPLLIKNVSPHAGFFPDGRPQVAIAGLETVTIWTQRNGTSNRVYSSYADFGEPDLPYVPSLSGWGIFLLVTALGGGMICLVRLRQVRKS
jgi:hypothetical protein